MTRNRLGSSWVLALLALLCVPAGARAQQTPLGPEFQVNIHTTGFQWRPAVAGSPAGAFVVVWESEGQDGDSRGVFGRLFSDSGRALTPEFQVNSYTTEAQRAPSVAMSPWGGFVVVWESNGQAGASGGVFGQRFDRAGHRLGGEFQVNTSTMDALFFPSVASGEDGGFIVVWTGPWDQDGSASGVFGQIFSSRGRPVGGEFQVNSYTTHSQTFPSVAVTTGGEFVVAWSSYGQDGSHAGVFGRRFDSAGTPLAEEFQINSYTTASQSLPVVGGSPSGEFVVVWASEGQDGSGPGVFGRFFGREGGPLGGEFRVNAWTLGTQTEPAVAVNGDGQVVVAWSGLGRGGTSLGVFGQQFDSSGAPGSGEFQIGTSTVEALSVPAVTLSLAGDLVVAWDSPHQDGSSYGVFARRLSTVPREELCDRFDNDGDGWTDEDFDLGLTCDGTGQCGEGTLECSAADPNRVRCSTAPGGSQDRSSPESCDGLDNDCDGLTDEGVCFVITSPLDGESVECSGPRSLPPTITWEAASFDRFAVFIAGEAAFSPATTVSSGLRLLSSASWTPDRRRWRRACRNAVRSNPGSPSMFLRVLGQDRSLPQGDPGRWGLTPVVQVEVERSKKEAPPG